MHRSTVRLLAAAAVVLALLATMTPAATAQTDPKVSPPRLREVPKVTGWEFVEVHTVDHGKVLNLVFRLTSAGVSGQKTCWRVEYDDQIPGYKKMSDGTAIPAGAKVNVNARRGPKYCEWETRPFSNITWEVFVHLVYQIPFGAADTQANRQAAVDAHFATTPIPGSPDRGQCTTNLIGHLVYRGFLTIPITCKLNDSQVIGLAGFTALLDILMDGLVAASAQGEIVKVEPFSNF